MKTTLIALASIAFICGCGGAADTSAVDKVIDSFATQQCAWEFKCCTDAEIKKKEGDKFTDQSGCLSFAKLAVENALYAERLAVKQGRIKVDNTQANACIAEQMAKACNPAPGSPPPTPPAPGFVDPCTLVFVGATAVGDACLFGNECIKGAHCVPTGGGEGVCVPYQHETEICNQSGDCDPAVFNLYCAHKDFKCHLRSPVGGPCAYTTDPNTMMPSLPLLLECDASNATLYCDPASSTCKTLPAAGQPCLSPRPPGVFNVCDTGLSCDATNGMPGTCRAPGGAGDPCSFAYPCKPNASLYCDTMNQPNTCKALPSLNENCQVSNQLCAKPYYCNTAMQPFVCAQPATLGMPCSFRILCDSDLYCDNTGMTQTCKAKLADGAACMQSQQCLSGFCNGGACFTLQGGVMCIGRM